MRSSEAVKLANDIMYKPGWTIRAVDLSSRYLLVVVGIDVPNSDREYAIHGYPKIITMPVSFDIDLHAIRSAFELYKTVLSKLMQIEHDMIEHEAREFFRIKPSYDAPFHPHRPEGNASWDTTRTVGYIP